MPTSAQPSSLPAILGGTPIRLSPPPEWPGQWPEVEAALQRSLADGSWGKYCGPNHEQLERHLCELFGVEHAILCASGTAAVELALRGAGVSTGDEVLLAGYDFKANFQNVLTLGALPVLSDITVETGQLDVSAIADAAPKVIIASHLHGGFVEIDALMSVADERDCVVIEDACQCAGALIGGRRAGSIGHVGVLSFGGSKLLTAGRGGAVLTNRADIAQRIRLHTQRGNEAYPLSELQATVLLPQFAKLEALNARRLASVRLLCDRIQAQQLGLSILASRWLDPANEQPATSPAFYKVGLLYDSAAFDGLSRDHFAAAMRAEGIALDAGFRALQLTHSKRRFRAIGELTNSAAADTRMLVLHHPVLLDGAAGIEEFVEAAMKIRQYAGDIRTGAPVTYSPRPKGQRR